MCIRDSSHVIVLESCGLLVAELLGDSAQAFTVSIWVLRSCLAFKLLLPIWHKEVEWVVSWRLQKKGLGYFLTIYDVVHVDGSVLLRGLEIRLWLFGCLIHLHTEWVMWGVIGLRFFVHFFIWWAWRGSTEGRRVHAFFLIPPITDLFVSSINFWTLPCMKSAHMISETSWNHMVADTAPTMSVPVPSSIFLLLLEAMLFSHVFAESFIACVSLFGTLFAFKLHNRSFTHLVNSLI